MPKFGTAAFGEDFFGGLGDEEPSFDIDAMMAGEVDMGDYFEDDAKYGEGDGMKIEYEEEKIEAEIQYYIKKDPQDRLPLQTGPPPERGDHIYLCLESFDLNGTLTARCLPSQSPT